MPAKSKGPWRHINAKIPTPIMDAIDAEARRRGLDRTALLTEILADRAGVPIPHVTQERLPLTDAA